MTYLDEAVRRSKLGIRVRYSVGVDFRNWWSLRFADEIWYAPTGPDATAAYLRLVNDLESAGPPPMADSGCSSDPSSPRGLS